MPKLPPALVVLALLVCNALGGRHLEQPARKHPNLTRRLQKERQPSVHRLLNDATLSFPKLTNDKTLSRAEGLCPDSDAIAPCDCTYTVGGGSLGDVYIECEGVSQKQIENVFQQDFPVPELIRLTILQSTVTSLDFDLNGVTFEILYVIDTPITMMSEEFLSSLSSSLYLLDLVDTQITVDGFPFAALENMELLSILSFNGANLDSLPNIVSPTIELLWFTNTPISSISPGSFDGMPLLNNIQFYKTEVTELEAGTFPIKDPSEKFAVSGIESIVLGAFYPVTDNSSVMQYDVIDGSLTELLPGTFPVGWNTHTLYLVNNSIETIHAGAFSILSPPPALGIDMTLNSNQLTEIDEEVFGPMMPYLRYLYLEDNPLTCGCDIAWIILDPTILARISLDSTCTDGRKLIELDPEYYEDQC